MTLPEFAYPLQGRYGNPNYAEQLAARILKEMKEKEKAVKAVRWNVEMTDTMGGEANYSWVRRGTTILSQDATRRQIVRAVKAELGITGVRCKTFDCGDMIEIRPLGECVVAFATVEY